MFSSRWASLSILGLIPLGLAAIFFIINSLQGYYKLSIPVFVLNVLGVFVVVLFSMIHIFTADYSGAAPYLVIAFAPAHVVYGYVFLWQGNKASSGAGVAAKVPSLPPQLPVRITVPVQVPSQTPSPSQPPHKPTPAGQPRPPMVCFKCGSENPADYVYCKYCGTKLQ